VKEFLLGPLLATQKLDVINQKKVGLAITLPELDQIAVLNRVDELVNEEFAREIDDLHVFFLRPNVLTDGLHQMGLTKTYPAVNEKRVVCARRRLRNGETCRVRNFVVWAYHERFKCVPWIESGDCCTWFCGARQFFQNFFQWRGLQRCLRAGS
jgi:hypothetical protein